MPLNLKPAPANRIDDLKLQKRESHSNNCSVKIIAHKNSYNYFC